MDVGQDLVLHYDIKQVLNMFQSMTGEILPSILTKGATQAELQDEAARALII